MEGYELRNAVYVFSMAIGGLIEAMGMQAENQSRLSRGEAIAYHDSAFMDVVNRNGIHHNAILTTFNNGA